MPGQAAAAQACTAAHVPPAPPPAPLGCWQSAGLVPGRRHLCCRGSASASAHLCAARRVKRIPSPIPDKAWYLTPPVIALVGGLLPFGSIFIEMYFIFTSFWNYKVGGGWVLGCCPLAW